MKLFRTRNTDLGLCGVGGLGTLGGEISVLQTSVLLLKVTDSTKRPISHLEEENARLKHDLSSKSAQLQAAQTKVSIAAEQLHIELDRLKAFKDRYRNP